MLKDKKILFGISGSFCNHAYVLEELKKLSKYNEVEVIVTPNVKETSTRFFEKEDFLQQLETITQKPVLSTLNDGEQIGPRNEHDLMVIAPATATVCAKLANGIYDNGMVLAAKAMIRNQKEVVIGFASNDGLGMSGKNIMLLLATKHYYVIPFQQDAPFQKPYSIVAKWDLLMPTLEQAYHHIQYQPILLGGNYE